MKGPIHVFLITFFYFFVELVGGLYYNSLALVTDSAFMVIDLVGQLCALYALRLGRKPPDKTKTFGYERIKVLAGLANGVLVLFLLIYVLTNAYSKMTNPEVMQVDKVFIIAVVGLFVNIYGAIRLYQLSEDISLRGSFLIMLNDALGSVGVITSTLIIKFTGFYFVDALTSIGIVCLVLYPTYLLVKQSINILMEGIPSGMDIERVEKFIYENFEAKQVKDLRVWALVPDKTIMTVKIRTDGRISNRDKIKKLKELLQNTFRVHDVFVEVYEM